MPELNLRKPHIEFGGGEGLRPVILQDGHCFAHDGTLLPSDPQILSSKGFAVPKDLRKTLIRERHRRDAELQIEKIKQELVEKQKAELARLDEKLRNVSELGDVELDNSLAELLDDVEDPVELEAPVPDPATVISRPAPKRTTSVRVNKKK